MTQAQEKLAMMRARLETAFSPSHLEIIDESDQHVGHAGHQGGGRHFAIVIASSALQGLSRVAAHQRVYEVFADKMPQEIHALRIKVI